MIYIKYDHSYHLLYWKLRWPSYCRQFSNYPDIAALKIILPRHSIVIESQLHADLTLASKILEHPWWIAWFYKLWEIFYFYIFYNFFYFYIWVACSVSEGNSCTAFIIFPLIVVVWDSTVVLMSKNAVITIVLAFLLSAVLPYYLSFQSFIRHPFILLLVYMLNMTLNTIQIPW
jgi:hypothetical protein